MNYVNIYDLLKGKKVNILTDVKIFVQLEIESIKEISNSRELEPATRANDWHPQSIDWVTYQVKFVNGYTKMYNKLSDIDFI